MDWENKTCELHCRHGQIIIFDCRSYEGNAFFRNIIPVRFGSWGPLYSPWGPNSDYNVGDTTEADPSFPSGLHNEDPMPKSMSS